MDQINKIYATVLYGFLFLANSANAQLVQVPDIPGFGNSNNALPLFPSSTMRYQQIYASSAFSHGGTIDKIMFRKDEEFPFPYGPVGIPIQVAIAYAATTVDTASPTFANNIGDDFRYASAPGTRSQTDPLRCK